MPNASIVTQDSANPAYIYAVVFVDELQRAGIRNVVICPGSRSTHLAMAFVAQTAIRTWMHVDERSAAFFGLGMAKQLRKPVALLCTSGTAAANFLPALVEAKLSHVSLLVLTADRPHELRDNGAPQSIHQNRLYGTYAKWFVEVALPEATDAAFRYIRTTADRAVATAQAIPSGPVHLNFPFREPLTPEPIPEQILPPVEQRDRIAWQGRPGNAPFIDVHDAPLGAPENITVGNILRLVGEAQRGLIIVGPNDDPTLVEPLVRLAQYLGYPILADPLSQLRCGAYNRSLVLTSYDAFLRIDSFIESAQPELLIRFGAMPTSKPLLLYLKRHASSPLVVIDGNSGWEEPTQLASQLIHANPTAVCQDLFTALVQHKTSEERPSVVSQTWLSLWQDTDKITQQALRNAIYDLNGLLAARLYRLNLTIILINNDGGGIFSFLPQAAYPEHFEQLFGTPTGLDFRLAVEMYGGRFQRVENWESFRKAVNQGLHTGGLHVIEIPAERTSNVKMHRQLWEVVKKAIDNRH